MLALTRAPWLSVFKFMVVTGLVALPQASASPDDPGKTSKAASGATAATISGRVTDQAGAPLADVRVSVVAVGDPETRTVNAGARSKQLVARSDARGDYRLEVPVITKRAIIVIDAFKPGYRSLRGPLMAAGDTKRFEVVPGTHEEADLVLKPALYFAGVVVDEQGKPIPGYRFAPALIGQFEIHEGRPQAIANPGGAARPRSRDTQWRNTSSIDELLRSHSIGPARCEVWGKGVLRRLSSRSLVCDLPTTSSPGSSRKSRVQRSGRTPGAPCGTVRCWEHQAGPTDPDVASGNWSNRVDVLSGRGGATIMSIPPCPLAQRYQNSSQSCFDEDSSGSEPTRK